MKKVCKESRKVWITWIVVVIIINTIIILAIPERSILIRIIIAIIVGYPSYILTKLILKKCKKRN
ncbi:hypothetical protein [Clostridium putrefaciens]|uniref:hypothetical protein n=1 Tax=Clostridium putrefaciens TaxID=99675 RepID=UPI0011C082E9|nr:hypothetical protein [Clostridium putrefaciens]